MAVLIQRPQAYIMSGKVEYLMLFCRVVDVMGDGLKVCEAGGCVLSQIDQKRC